VDEGFKQRRARIGALTLALGGLFALTAVRLAVIVLVEGPWLRSLGRSEHSAQIELASVRGPIVDREGKPLALSAETRSVYARPRTLLAGSSPEDRAHLAAVLGMSVTELESRLVNGASFVWLERHVAPSRAHAIEQLGLKGVDAVSEYKRFYPEGNLAAAVVGMAGMDGQGLSGVELQYDKLVGAEPVGLHFYQDALGHPILDSPLPFENPKVGARLELTVDSSIQAEAENYLSEQVVESGASRGTAVIIDPFTGELLALANVGAGRSGAADRLHDSAVQDAFEPGSTMKGLLAAIALEDQVANTSRQIYCEQGEWQVAGTPIHDDGRYGWLTLSEIIEVSSNIGAAKLALALGRRRFYDGIVAFGLGRRSGIDLPGEASGMVRPPSSWRELELANHGFGQGLAVTAIQLVAAYAAIANGGLVMRPYVVKAAYDADGREVMFRSPQVFRRAISPAVAHTMNQVLRGVVNDREGTAHLARVADFTVAGKTGTAQMVDPVTKTYYRDRLVASFVGFVPAEDPKLVILVVLYDVPRGHFGGLVAAPVFSKIASDALQRMAVPPAYRAVEAANLLPISSALRVLTSLPVENDDSRLASADEPALPSGLAQDSAESVGDEWRRNDVGIPDFRGLSLRSALAVARTHQLALKVTGGGYVVSQEPRAGFLMKMDRLPTPETAGEGVQIVLAAPDRSPPSPAYAVERMADMPDSTSALSLAATGSQSSRRELPARPLAKRRAQGWRHCRDTSVATMVCLGQ
jgi:cell division protein FtsI (penicillin-binding protein 3)